MITTIIIFLAGAVVGMAALVGFAVFMLVLEHQEHTPNWKKEK